MHKSDKPTPDPNIEFLDNFKALYRLSDSTKVTLLTNIKSIDRTITQTTNQTQWEAKRED